MIENEPEKPKKGWGCLQWSVVLVVLVLVVYNFVPTYGLISVKANQMKGRSNARQITGLLLTYASDNSGHYPDFGKDLSKLTSNHAFRELVKEGLVQDETIFSCPGSPFASDKDVGLAPDYAKALTPGENHWMLVAGLKNNSPAHYPLVIENAVDASWPLRWMPYPSYISRKLASIRGINENRRAVVVAGKTTPSSSPSMMPLFRLLSWISKTTVCISLKASSNPKARSRCLP